MKFIPPYPRPFLKTTSMKKHKIEYQIEAIQKAINEGKVKNKYPAENKIRQLKKKLQELNWINHLAR